MRNYLPAVSTFLLLGTQSAHHGSTPHFDPDDMVTMQSVVKDLRFVNLILSFTSMPLT